MIQKLEKITYEEFFLPHDKTLNNVKPEEFERIPVTRLPNTQEMMNKINEIIDVVNKITRQ